MLFIQRSKDSKFSTVTQKITENLFTHAALATIRGVNAWRLRDVGARVCASRRLGPNGTCTSAGNSFLLGNSQYTEVILGTARNSDIQFFTNFASYTQGNGYQSLR
jgi:hypothetical protein